MPKFKVTYENEVDNSKTPFEAASEMLDHLRTGGPDGLVFIVEELKTGKKFSVDMGGDEKDVYELDWRESIF